MAAGGPGAAAAMPVIGFLSSGSAAPWAHLVAALRDGLKEIGFLEGQNVAIDFHWADGQYDRLPTIAAELGSAEGGRHCRGGGAHLQFFRLWQPRPRSQSYSASVAIRLN